MSIRVYYDGKCGLCSKEIRHYMRIDKAQRFTWIDVIEERDELSTRGISLSDALMYLHAIDNEGKVKVGVDAFILIWNNLPGWRLLGPVTNLPVINPFAKWLYNRFARWRYNRLSYCNNLSNQTSTDNKQ